MSVCDVPTYRDPIQYREGIDLISAPYISSPPLLVPSSPYSSLLPPLLPSSTYSSLPPPTCPSSLFLIFTRRAVGNANAIRCRRPAGLPVYRRSDEIENCAVLHAAAYRCFRHCTAPRLQPAAFSCKRNIPLSCSCSAPRPPPGYIWVGKLQTATFFPSRSGCTCGCVDGYP